MKKTFYYLAFSGFLSLMSLSANAQQKVKDGTVSGSSSLPHAGAIQELESTNKGHLLPRVSLSSTTVWGLAGTQVAGMEVYNTNSGIVQGSTQYPANGAGLYYWNGSGWVSTKATKDLSQADSYQNPIVLAYMVSGNEIATNNTWFYLDGFTERRDLVNGFNPTNGVFTAPITATYIFDITANAIFTENWPSIHVSFAAKLSTPASPAWRNLINPVINPTWAGGPHVNAANFLIPAAPTVGNYAEGGNGKDTYPMSFALPIQLNAGESICFQAMSYYNNGTLGNLGISNFRVDIANY